MTDLARFDAYVDAHREEFVRALQELCRQPCISAQGSGIAETAQNVAGLLDGVGASGRLLETDGAPIVGGEVGSGPRTLLIYDHYDVQPPDPIDEWESPPFDPQVRDGKLYARGVSDNRADILARILAVSVWQQTIGELPLRVRWAIEGEEEIASPSLPVAARRHCDAFAADGCLWEGSEIDDEERFVIDLGVKGDYYADVVVEGPAYDLHSSLAAIVPNPAWRLSWALASLKAPDETIAIDGLLDHVTPPSAAAEEMLARIPLAEDKIKRQLGISSFVNDLGGVALLRKFLFEPTCTISGLVAGYTGTGSKTVMPARALAKLDIRLVPGLDPDLVDRLLRAHLDRRGFSDVQVRRVGRGLRPVRTAPDSAIVHATVEAARDLYGEPVLYPNAAGSGPMDTLGEDLGIPISSAGGIWYPGARAHAPDENVRIDDYIRGIKYIGRVFDRFSAA